MDRGNVEKLKFVMNVTIIFFCSLFRFSIFSIDCMGGENELVSSPVSGLDN